MLPEIFHNYPIVTFDRFPHVCIINNVEKIFRLVSFFRFLFDKWQIENHDIKLIFQLCVSRYTPPPSSLYNAAMLMHADHWIILPQVKSLNYMYVMVTFKCCCVDVLNMKGN